MIAGALVLQPDAGSSVACIEQRIELLDVDVEGAVA